MTNRYNWNTGMSIMLPYFSDARMKELRENDINYMELTGGNIAHFEDFDKKAKNIFKTAENNGVKISSVHLPFSPFDKIDPASTDKEKRDNFLKIQSELVKISSDCGAEIAVVHPSGEPYKEENRDEHFKYSVNSIYELHELAKKEGIILAVENLPRTCICRDCKELDKMISEIPDIHFVFDSNHSLIDKNSEIIKTMGERIVALHISDYEFIDEMHLFPGEGKNDWKEIMSCLEQINYTGTWNYEIRQTENKSARLFKDNHKMLLSL